MDKEESSPLAERQGSRHDGGSSGPEPRCPPSAVPPYVPEQVALDDIRRLNVPVNVPVYVEPMHFMASVQSFSRGGYEATVKLVDAQRIAEQRCLARRVGPRLPRSDHERDAGDILRSRLRAKKRVRHVCKEIGADRIVTLTTREESSTVEAMLGRWQRWLRLLERANGRPFHYVAVLEPHPSNPEHLHIRAMSTSSASDRATWRTGLAAWLPISPNT